MSSRPKILIVDDVPANLDTLSHALAQDYELSVTTSAASVITLVQELEPDLVLLDAMTPEIDGPAVLSRIRASAGGANLPLILFIADKRLETHAGHVEELEFGADHFITKPISIVSLKASIANLLERSRLRDRLRVSEEQYRSLTDDAPVCISAIAPDGTLIFVNGEAAALVGSDPGALLGRCVFDFLSADERDRLQAGLAHLSPEQPLQSHEQTHRTLGGERRILKWINRAIFDARGRLSHYQSVGIDVTAHKSVKEAAKALSGPLARADEQAFPNEACRLLAEITGADLTFFGMHLPVDGQIRVVAGWMDGPLPPFHYDPASTLCRAVIDNGECIVTDIAGAGLIAAVPVDGFDAAAYVGKAIHDRDGHPMGLLVALKRSPVSEATGQLIATTVDLFAERMRSEIQRSNTARSIQHQLMFQRAAAELGKACAVATDEAGFERAISQCLERIGELLNADLSYVLRFSETMTSLRLAYDWCGSELAGQATVLRDFTLEAVPWWRARLINEGLVHIPDVASLPDEARNEKALFEQKGIRSLADAAMYGPKGCLRGAVGVCRMTEAAPWSDEELEMLKTLAGLVGAVVDRRLADEALAQSKLLLETAIAQSPSGILIADAPDVTIRLANAAALRIRGPRDSQLLTGIDVANHAAKWQTFRPDGTPFPSESLPLSRAVLKGETVQGEEVIIRNEAGEERWVIANAAPIRNTAGEITSGVVVFHDITERKCGEDKLKQAASVFQYANEGIIITDTRGGIVDVNQAFIEITGYTRDEVLGRSTRLLSSGMHEPVFYQEMWQSLDRIGSWAGEIWNKRKNGQIYPERLTISAVRDNTGRIAGFVGLFSDISEEKAYQQRLENLARYDALTGLPNRALLADRMQQAIDLAHCNGTLMAVAYIDLDGFKEVNDQHGHDAGDRLLVTVAERMKSVLREGDTLSRLGGDEFVAVLGDFDEIDDCMPMLDRLLHDVAKAVPLDDFLLKVSASIGVSVYPQPDYVDPDQLVRQADQAMYQAKLSGKNRYRLFDAHHERHMRDRHDSLERIREAFKSNEFVLHYQPKIRLRSGMLIGTEALIRWQHPERGLLSPASFLPVLDGHAMMVELGDWVINTALSQITEWREQGLSVPVSVNVDALQLHQSDFADKLRAALDRHPLIRPGDLELEIVETSALGDFAHVSQLMASCKALGVGFALDDFGTGYSSLTYLKDLSVDSLKIDQSFVRDILENARDLAILDGIVGLADALQRDIIAEGVEKNEHGEILLQLGCEIGQGYVIARPMPADEIANWRPDPSLIASWATCMPLSRDMRSALFARVAHLSWMMDLRRHVRGEQINLPALDPHGCDLGRWLDRLIGQAGDQDLLVDRIATLHGAVHELAQELIDALRDGDMGQIVANRLDVVEQASTRLLGALDDMLRSGQTHGASEKIS